MAFEKGNKLSPGRPKGSQNKDRTIVRSIIEEALGRRLPTAIIEELKTGPKELRVKVMMELMEYAYPKLRATEVSGSLDVDMETHDASIDALKNELIKHATESFSAPVIGTSDALY